MALCSFFPSSPPPRPCSSGVAILPCSQGDPEDPVTLNEVVGVVFKLFKHPLGSIGIQWKSWIQLVFWKCVVIICYLCWPPWHFCVQKSGFPIKEYQQEHKNNAVRRNMNIYMNIYPAIWQVVIFFSCWPPVAVSPSDGCSTIVWLGVPKVYQRSQVTKKWGSRVPPLFFRRVIKLDWIHVHVYFLHGVVYNHWIL